MMHLFDYKETKFVVIKVYAMGSIGATKPFAETWHAHIAHTMISIHAVIIVITSLETFSIVAFTANATIRIFLT